jgi:opacity protein-like surface antigen
MRRHLVAAVVVLAVALGAAVPAAAQVGVLLHAGFDSTTFESKQSFEAVTGTSSVEGGTFGLTFTHLWRGVFVDVAAAKRTLNGERVFVHGGTVFRLGIPATIEWQPLDVAAGWRFGTGRVTPYAGVGMTTIRYKESARFAQASDDVSESASGLLMLGGVDVTVWRRFRLGGEVRYRSVTGVLGSGGASEAFGEDQLGGTSAAVRLSFGR